MDKKLLYVLTCLFIVGALANCRPVPAKPSAVTPPCQLFAGSSIELVANDMPDGNIDLQWSAAVGNFSSPTSSSVTYTAPQGFAGNVTIELTTTRGGQSVTETITCTVVLPPTATPTNTPLPTATATLPPPPPPTNTPSPTPTPSELDLSLVTPVSGGALPRALVYEAEASGTGDMTDREHAFGKRTVHLATGNQIEFEIDVPQDGFYILYIRHSNDNLNEVEKENLMVSLDGTEQPGNFQSVDTGDGGAGWDVFVHPWYGDLYLTGGSHTIALLVEGGDGYGIEIDAIILVPR